MERLTFEGNFCEIALCLKTPGGSYCENGMCSQRKVWERLKAYEDTGQTPEIIFRLLGTFERLDEIKALDHLIDLVKAEKDGRLLILPCKVGDTVFLLDRHMRCVHECEAEFVNIGPHEKVVIFRSRDDGGQYGAVFSEFGKTVFFNREEAKAALREAKKDG